MDLNNIIDITARIKTRLQPESISLMTNNEKMFVNRIQASRKKLKQKNKQLQKQLQEQTKKSQIELNTLRETLEKTEEELFDALERLGEKSVPEGFQGEKIITAK